MRFLHLACLALIIFHNSNAEEISEFEHVSVEIINKITAEKSEVQLNINKEIIFENIAINAKKCVILDEDNKNSYAFLEIYFLNDEHNKIFTGWLSSDSISLNSVENNVYDINLISSCYN